MLLPGPESVAGIATKGVNILLIVLMGKVKIHVKHLYFKHCAVLESARMELNLKRTHNASSTQIKKSLSSDDNSL